MPERQTVLRIQSSLLMSWCPEKRKASPRVRSKRPKDREGNPAGRIIEVRVGNCPIEILPLGNVCETCTPNLALCFPLRTTDRPSRRTLFNRRDSPKEIVDPKKDWGSLNT